VNDINPHLVDEDPEDHIGDEQKDPWEDEQSGWKAEYKLDPVDEQETEGNA